MAENKGRTLKVIGKAASAVMTVLLAAVTVLTVYIMVCSVRGKVANVFGVSIVKVVTGSMEPSIQIGDYIMLKKTDVSMLREEDIICFYSRDKEIYGKPNTHRIVRVLDDGSFVTKGDASLTEDSVKVLPETVIGKYDGKVRFLRWINSFASLKKVLLIAVIIIMTAVAVYEVYTITKISAESREQRKQKAIREAIDREKQKLYEQGGIQLVEESEYPKQEADD